MALQEALERFAIEAARRDRSERNRRSDENVETCITSYAQAYAISRGRRITRLPQALLRQALLQYKAELKRWKSKRAA